MASPPHRVTAYDVNGSFSVHNRAKIERWHKHFEHLLNFQTEPSILWFPSAAEFQSAREARTKPNQTGFRDERGYSDRIFTLRHIPEFRRDYQQPMAVCFAVAFDSVHHESLRRIMAPDGVPPKAITRIKVYYRPTTARVLAHSKLFQPLTIRCGVRKVLFLSPILFDYTIDWILGNTPHNDYATELAPRG
ncbi:unnamed protein product [Dibothriocephalus latus]|uniref:Uncharacterized protein n=1 Tax=Dibothriocephalus latus TaxID=60516 RepID=A0A3P6Q9Q3_DIBLA|nr:unnamed protein product [Dibothriocephalus latus]